MASQVKAPVLASATTMEKESPSFLSSSILSSSSMLSSDLKYPPAARLSDSSSSSSRYAESSSSSSEPSSPECCTSPEPGTTKWPSFSLSQSLWPITSLVLTLALVPRHLTVWQSASLGLATLAVVLGRAGQLTKRVRSFVQPPVIRRVVTGTKTVAAIQRYRNPVLDTIMCAMAMTISIECYTAFLPLLIFSGRSELGISMAMLLALGIYFGNSIKDLVCAPRPFTPPAVRVTGSTLEVHNSKEYGLPSTHTINIVSLSLYMLHWLQTRAELDPAYGPYIVVTLFTITVLVIFGRLYLGMHSPIDIAAGLVVGLALTAAWSYLDFTVLHFIQHGQNAAFFSTAVCLFALVAYPEPEDPTPSYEDHTSFVGVILGLCLALRMSPVNATTIPLSVASLVPLLIRITIGLPVALAAKSVGKEAAKLALPQIFLGLGIPITSRKYVTWLHTSAEFKGDAAQQVTQEGQVTGADKLQAQLGPQVFDIDILIRLTQYAALAGTVQLMAAYGIAFLRL